MTDRRHYPSHDAPPPSDSMMGGEPTLVQMEGAGLSLILERAMDSQGDEPVTLLPGMPQGPLSVGRQGQFCLDGRGVLGVHGYLMWDGKGFFVASADEASPVVVEGIRITKDWTRIEAPCSLLFGRTLMMLRMATVGEPTLVNPARPPQAPAPGGIPRHDYNLGRPLPIMAPSSENTVMLPPVYHDVTPSDPTRQIPVRPPFQDMERPQHFAAPDDSSTRVNRDSPALPVFRPPSGDDESTRLHTDGWEPPTRPVDSYVSPHAGPESLAHEPTAPAPGRPIPAGYVPAGTPGYAPPMQARQGRQPQDASFPDVTPAPPRAMDSAPETKRPPIGKRLSSDSQRMARKLQAAVGPGSRNRTPIVVAVCAVLGALVAGGMIFLKSLRQQPVEVAPVPTKPAPVGPAPTLAATEPVPTAAPPPPGMVLYPAPPRKAIDAGVVLGATDDPRRAGRDAGPPSLERSAIDAINRGDLNAALLAYRQLAQQQPDNPAFANAVRALQQKANVPSGPNR